MDPNLVLGTLLTTALIYYAPSLWRTLVNNWKLRSIPTVGTNSLLAPLIGPRRFSTHGHEMLLEGYDKYRGSFFKIPITSHWIIVAADPRFTEEIRQAPEVHLSFHKCFVEMLGLNVTIGPETYDDYHVDVIRNTLTKNLREKFSDIQDEVATAFADYIPAYKKTEWVKVNAFSIIINVVCRLSNRVFVGLPLCRDPDYMALHKEFTLNIFRAYHTIDKFPPFLRWIAASLFTTVSQDVKRGVKHLGPLIKERLEKEAQYGKDWPEKPNDLLSWLLEAAQEDQRNIRDLSLRILLINLAAIYTATMTFAYVLYDLATHPEYVQPMREEVEAVLREEGWTHASIAKLSKVDSFIKESLRTSFIESFGVKRKVMKDFMFSDGTMIPAGNVVAVPLEAIQRDPDNFENPETFDGFRFDKIREQEGDPSKHKLVSLETNYVLFGHGRQSCPGRFFAVNELKTMLAHILVNYDTKMANGAGRPANKRIGQEMTPDITAEVLFRRRV